MKKAFVALVCVFMLSGCATTGGGTAPTQGTVDQIVDIVIAGTAKACQFLPVAADVAVLASASDATTQTAAQIAQAIITAICSAPVATATIKRGTAQYTRIVDTRKGAVKVRGTRVVR